MRFPTLMSLLALAISVTAVPRAFDEEPSSNSTEPASTDPIDPDNTLPLEFRKDVFGKPQVLVGPNRGVNPQVYIDCLLHEVDVKNEEGSWGRRICKKDYRVRFAIRKHGFWASRHDCWNICKQTLMLAINAGFHEYECRWHASGWNKCRMQYYTIQEPEAGREVWYWKERDRVEKEKLERDKKGITTKLEQEDEVKQLADILDALALEESAEEDSKSSD